MVNAMFDRIPGRKKGYEEVYRDPNTGKEVTLGALPDYFTSMRKQKLDFIEAHRPIPTKPSSK
jgi:hypothetical protein